MRKPRRALPALLLLTLAGLALPAGAGAVGLQTYVSGVGDDANPCTVGAPCRTWAGTISKTTAGGTMTALDSGAFGTVTITKSITVDGAGYLAGTLASGTPGIIVNGTGIDVVLHGLDVDAAGICAAAPSPHGIRFVKGNSLTLQDVSVQGFAGAGLSLEPSDGHGTVVARDSTFINNCTAGVLAASPFTSGDFTARLQDDLVTGNATGVRSGSHAAVTLSSDTIVANATQTATEADGTLTSLGDNRIGGVAGTLGSWPVAPGPDPGPPVAAAPVAVTPAPPLAAPTPTPTRRAPKRYKMPKLTNLTLAGAERALTRAHYRLGAVRYRVKHVVRRGRVYGQRLDTGRLRVAGTAVGLSVSGRAPRALPARARAAAVIGTATRAWVSATGDDSFACSRTAPCRTFAQAVTHTAQNGIVDVLGDGDYGAVTIDHALTIDGGGATSSIAVDAGDAITVAAGAGEQVMLRNLDLTTVTPCTAPGAGDGIAFQSGGALVVEGVTARGFPGAGIALAPVVSGTATIRAGALTDNCTAGLTAQQATVVADGVDVSANATGIVAGAGALVQLTGGDVSGNANGFAATGSGQIQGWPTATLGPNAAPGFTPGTLPLS